MARRRGKVLRVLGGTALMVAFVAVVVALLAQRAGTWGVPYFSFTSAHGSRCTNDFTGYTCSPLTLADVQFFGDVDLPEDTTVLSGSYRATHDYQLTAQLAVPEASAGAALDQLHEAYGGCRKGVTPPLDTAGLSGVCTMTNGAGTDADGQPSSRIWSVGTGTRPDGARLVGIALRSR